MSLARRIDFEVARALEWRAGALTPLPGAAAVEESLAADLEAGSPGEPVGERARLLLKRPGEKAVAWLAVAVLVLLALAAAAGMQVARFALGEPEDGPVNVVWFLGHALGLQSLLLLLTLFVTFGARTALGRLLGQTLSLGGLALGAAVRLVGRGSGSEPGAAGEVLDRLRSLRALRPLALSVSHGAWLSFNVALIAAAALILSAEHHAFGWQSTLVKDELRAERVLRALTLPAMVWPGAPTSEQVRVSRYDPEAGGFLDDAGRPAEATTLRQAWSLQLLSAVAGYGLLPRALLLLLSWISWRLHRRRLLPAGGDPYLDAVLARLAPAVTTEPDDVAQEPLALVERSGPPAEAEGPLRTHAAAWLGAVPRRDPVEALLGRAEPEWIGLPRLDSRGAEAAALEALRPPAELVLLCDWSTTPDASLGRFLQAARPARTVLVLTGGGAFRATRRGATPESVRARRAAWEKAATRWGVAAEDLVDFDVESATPASRAVLAARLLAASEGAAPRPSTGRGLAEALDRVREAAPSWAQRLGALSGAELEARQLRAAANVRRDVEACFAEAPEPARAGRTLVAAGRAALSRAVDAGGLGDEGWSEALGEAARLGRLLAKVRRIDARWSLAGLALGLVAGPLGGAIAAGSAGLLAGASLTSTLAPLGAALGSALSLKRGSGASGEEATEPAPATDALGLPARAGVLRALELHLQGRGEEAVARVLGDLTASTAGRAALAGPAEVEALCDAALALGEAS